MANTQTRIFVTSAAWTTITAGPITTGTISPETQSIRVAIETAGAPTDLTQGHVVYARDRFDFVLSEGDTLYAIAAGSDTSLIVTSGSTPTAIVEIISPTTSGSTSSEVTAPPGTTITADALGVGETVIVEFTSNGSDWQDLVLNNVTQELTNTHKTITIEGPLRFRVAKGVTVSSVGVYLWRA